MSIKPKRQLQRVGFIIIKKETKKEIILLKKTFEAFIKSSEYLCTKLSYERGAVSKEEMLNVAKKCAKVEKDIPMDELQEYVKLLYEAVGSILKAEDVSDILECSIDDAVKAIESIEEIRPVDMANSFATHRISAHAKTKNINSRKHSQYSKSLDFEKANKI